MNFTPQFCEWRPGLAPLNDWNEYTPEPPTLVPFVSHNITRLYLGELPFKSSS